MLHIMNFTLHLHYLPYIVNVNDTDFSGGILPLPVYTVKLKIL